MYLEEDESKQIYVMDSCSASCGETQLALLAASLEEQGLPFEQALSTREFEPDGPNWTPRISAILNADGSFEMSILKHKNGRCLREFFCYEGCDENQGYFISTYQGDGNPLPTFAGEPLEVTVPKPEEVWAALNGDNKVSLYTNVNGEVRLFNKNLGD